MSWEVDFTAKPFKLAVRKTSTRPVQSARFSPFAMPDSLYRMAVRRVVAKLIEENRRLRSRPYYRAGVFTSALADALSRWAKARWPR